nr:helicase RepA family protein [Acidisoma sp. PAMC 29798]
MCWPSGVDSPFGYTVVAEGPAFWVDRDDAWDEAAIPPRPWVVPGYLMRNTLSLVVGSPAAGKSLLALLWSIALALGEPVGKFKPIPGAESPRRRVLIINAEDDADEQRRRISSLIRQFGKRAIDLDGWLTRAGPEKIASLFERNAETGKITRTAALADLRLLIEETGASVVILDPLVELTTGVDENSNGDLKQVLAELRTLAKECGVAMLIVHHLRKGIAAPGDLDSARGASSIIGAIRVGMTLTGMNEEEAAALGISPDTRRNYVRLDDGKQSYAPLGDAEWFERIGIELANGDWAPTLLPWSVPKDTVTSEARAAIESGIARGSPDGPWSPTLSPKPRSVKHLLVSHGITTGDGQRKLMQDLIAGGFEVAQFKDARTRKIVTGLRTSDGRPTNADWKGDDGDE